MNEWMNEWIYEYPLFKNAAFSNEFFSLAGRICSGGFSFNWENVTFATCFILSGCDTHISAVIFSGSRDLPSDARTFIVAKKAHQSSTRRCHV